MSLEARGIALEFLLRSVAFSTAAPSRKALCGIGEFCEDMARLARACHTTLDLRALDTTLEPSPIGGFLEND